MTTQRIDVGDCTLDVLLEGPEDGPLAVLLHGFPDCRTSFASLAAALADAGYRVARPAMRGYPPSTVSATSNYQVAALGHDALALHEALHGDGRAVLIGHDWGAAATYSALSAAPDRWRKAVTMSVPPPLFVAQLFMNFQQLQRSWYMWFFQLPFAEVAVSLNDNAFIEGLWRLWSPKLTDLSVCDEVRHLLADPAHLTAALGYYRHLFDADVLDERHRAVFDARFTPSTVPTLYLHGTDDQCMNGLDDTVVGMLAPGSKLTMVEGVGHFLQLEDPATVNRLVLEWLGD